MRKLCILLCLLLLVAGCGQKAAEGGQIAYLPTETGASGPAGSASAVPVATAAPLFTAVPTQAPAPAPTCTPAPTPTPAPTFTPAPTAVPLEFTLRQYVSAMTDREKIGQLVMFGFSGTNSVSGEFAKIMTEYAIGNVILYGNNISRGDKDGGFDRCARLTGDIRAHAATDIPLLISLDVEGGSVTRFRWRNKIASPYAYTCQSSISVIQIKIFHRNHIPYTMIRF